MPRALKTFCSEYPRVQIDTTRASPDGFAESSPSQQVGTAQIWADCKVRKPRLGLTRVTVRSRGSLAGGQLGPGAISLALERDAEILASRCDIDILGILCAQVDAPDIFEDASYTGMESGGVTALLEANCSNRIEAAWKRLRAGLAGGLLPNGDRHGSGRGSQSANRQIGNSINGMNRMNRGTCKFRGAEFGRVHQVHVRFSRGQGEL